MPAVGSYAAKTHLPQLLDRVANGETITITRRGTPVAVLTQPPRQSSSGIRSVIAEMKKLRQGNKLGKGLSVRDLIANGRRH